MGYKSRQLKDGSIEGSQITAKFDTVDDIVHIDQQITVDTTVELILDDLWDALSEDQLEVLRDRLIQRKLDTPSGDGSFIGMLQDLRNEMELVHDRSKHVGPLYFCRTDLCRKTSVVLKYCEEWLVI